MRYQNLLQMAFFTGAITSTALHAAPTNPRTFEGSGVGYQSPGLSDLAKEDVGPLTEQEKAEYTQDALAAMNSEKLDIIYSRLTSGPIPHGFFAGKVMVPGDRGLDLIAPMLGRAPDTAKVKAFAEQLWSGKFFDRKLRWLQNRINLTGTAEVPTKVNDKNMLFPAKLYCGQSLFDSRRESIIIDYKYGEQDYKTTGLTADAATEAQRAALNRVAGPKGLGVRDEIRMVSPGLYLGRAYLQGVFGLYFILKYDTRSNSEMPPEQLVSQYGDECWIGHQRQLKLGKKPSDYVNNN